MAVIVTMFPFLILFYSLFLHPLLPLPLVGQFHPRPHHLGGLHLPLEPHPLLLEPRPFLLDSLDIKDYVSIFKDS